MSLEDFDVLNILGDSISSASYKVKNKITGEVFVWRSVDYQNYNDNEKNSLLNKIATRKNIIHPNVLQFYNIIDQKESSILYIVTEYCHNGSLQNMVDSCQERKNYFSEESICTVLYQIVCALKTLKQFNGNLSTEEIFLDEDFNVKLYHFNSVNKNAKCKEPKMFALGIVMFELCTLRKFDKINFEREFKQFADTIYSSSILSVITHMIKDNNDIKKNIDKILCHPTVLLKSSQWCRENRFHKCYSVNKETINKKECDSDELSLKKLKCFQASLKCREQKLVEKEHKLINREKKVALMERLVNDKLTQAELYLKRCRETKSTSNDSIKENTLKKTSYENLDSTSYSADCGDSLIIPTSTKLNIKNIVKPATFTRTMSERRIRFKGHSPLKEINFNKKKSSQRHHSRIIKEPPPTLRNVTECPSNSENDSEKSSKKSVSRKSVQLFPSQVQQHVYENEQEIDGKECRPISWTDENKKYAFDLLRIMNGEVDKENCAVDVKHTYL